MKLLLMLTFLFEAPVGVLMSVAPSVFFSAVFGVDFDTPAGSIAARIAGVAILSLAIVCGQSRNSKVDTALTSIVAAMLFYNAAVNVVLVYAGTALYIQGPLLWPAIVVHSVMGCWCLLLLMRSQRRLVEN